jgi:hypothetical protein
VLFEGVIPVTFIRSLILFFKPSFFEVPMIGDFESDFPEAYTPTLPVDETPL